MKSAIISAILALVFTATSFAGSVNQENPQQGPEKTLKNLQKAYQDEANAARKYELYSEKATEEGYEQIARLFCAASESETIHMRNHKNAIERLGGKPEPIVYEKVNVRTTKKNLKEPIGEENKESSFTYPQYIRTAKKENAEVAVETFEYARKSEAGHRKLFKEALSDFDNPAPKDYYVSSVSGETVEVMAGAPAPEPTAKGEKMIKEEF